jgi:hypothetical protein
MRTVISRKGNPYVMVTEEERGLFPDNPLPDKPEDWVRFEEERDVYRDSRAANGKRPKRAMTTGFYG